LTPVNQSPPHFYELVATAIDPGKEFTFYVVSQCSNTASVQLPELVKVKTTPEEKWKDAHLGRFMGNPIEAMGFAFVTAPEADWFSGKPCTEEAPKQP
jgi:hypothetical protein